MKLYLSQDAVNQDLFRQSVFAAHAAGFDTWESTITGHMLCGKHGTSELVDVFPDGSWSYTDGKRTAADRNPVILKLMLSSDEAMALYFGDKAPEDEPSTTPEIHDTTHGVVEAVKSVPHTALLKAKKKRVESTPLSTIDMAQKALTTTLAEYLRKEGKRIAKQIVKAMPAKKSALAHALLKTEISADDILNKTNLNGFATVVSEEISPEIEAAFNAAGLSSLAQLGMTVQMNLVNKEAVAHAEARAAELVTNIPDSTRTMLRGTVMQALNDGWDQETLTDNIINSRAFAPERAALIAGYELGNALGKGDLAAWKSSGVVIGKQWITADDEIVSDECNANAAQGVIPIDEAFQSGDDAPLAHPYCRCSSVAITDQSEE
jgi:hypothetical protein